MKTEDAMKVPMTVTVPFNTLVPGDTFLWTTPWSFLGMPVGELNLWMVGDNSDPGATGWTLPADHTPVIRLRDGAVTCFSPSTFPPVYKIPTQAVPE